MNSCAKNWRMLVVLILPSAMHASDQTNEVYCTSTLYGFARPAALIRLIRHALGYRSVLGRLPGSRP